MNRRLAVAISALFLLLTTTNAPVAYAIDGPALLTSCVNSINDPLYTRSSIASIMGLSVSSLEALITNGTTTVWIANGSGVITGSGNANGQAQDLFCGDSNNNSIASMDSYNNNRDYFFGGAGDDSVTGTMWFSTFYGGPGNDYVDSLEEASIFEGGPGNDSYRLISTAAPWASTFNQGADLLEVTSFAVAGNAKVANLRTVLTLTLIVTTAAKVTFFANGRRIAGCISKATTGSGSTFTAACAWKPSIKGPTSITLSIVQNISGAVTTYIHPTKVTVLVRTGSRTP